MNTGIRKNYITAFLILFLTTPLFSLPNFWDDKPDEELCLEIVNSMTDEELLGQVFFLGYLGTTPSSYIKNWITQRNLGGIKIFTRNIATLASLAQSIKDMQLLTQKNRFQIPLLIATDQEGGWVHHIRQESSSTGGNLSLGATGLPHDALLSGYYIGLELKALGINMNFAPNLDIYSNPKADAVGPRAFSSNPQQVGLLGIAYFNGLKRAGVIGTGKHFPGHGGAELDSHGYLPQINISFEQMWERELIPYRLIIKEGLPAIMSAHLAFPQITGKVEPATLSPFFLKDILRHKLNFQGVVITDSLEMYGVRANGLSFPVVCQKALEAGNDMVLLSHTPSLQEESWNWLLYIIKTSSTFKLLIKQAVLRILLLKMHTFKGENPFPYVPDVNKVYEYIPTENAPQFFFDSNCRSATIIRASNIPYLPAPEEKILIISQYQAFLEEGLNRYPQADILNFDWEPGIAYQAHIAQIAKNYDTVIFCLANEYHLEVLKSLKDLNLKIYVISALTPVYLQNTPWIKSAIAVYGESRQSFTAGFAVLRGDFIPEGKLPVDFIEP